MEMLEVQIEGGVKEIVAGGELIAEVAAPGHEASTGLVVVGWERPGGGGAVVEERAVVWEGGRRVRLRWSLPTGPTCARGELGATWYIEARAGEAAKRVYFRLMPAREASAGAVARRDVAQILAPEDRRGIEAGEVGLVGVGAAGMALGAALSAWGIVGVGVLMVGAGVWSWMSRREEQAGVLKVGGLWVEVEPGEARAGEQVVVRWGFTAVEAVRVVRAEAAVVYGERRIERYTLEPHSMHRGGMAEPAERFVFEERLRLRGDAAGMAVLEAGQAYEGSAAVALPQTVRGTTPGGVGDVWQAHVRVTLGEGAGIVEEWAPLRVIAAGAGREEEEERGEGGGGEATRGGGW